MLVFRHTVYDIGLQSLLNFVIISETNDVLKHIRSVLMLGHKVMSCN